MKENKAQTMRKKERKKEVNKRKKEENKAQTMRKNERKKERKKEIKK